MFVPRAVRQRSAVASPSVTSSIGSSLPSAVPSAPPLTSSVETAGDPPSSVVLTHKSCTPASPSSAPSFLRQSLSSGPDVKISSIPANGRLSCSVVSEPPRAPFPDCNVLSTDCRGPSEDEAVKKRSSDQRAPELGEPTCVLCGRYGEYICDETDDDVCSEECKGVLLKRVSNAILPDRRTGHPVPKTVVHSRESLPCMQDEMEIIVRDSERNLPEWEPSNQLTEQQVDMLRKQIEISVQGDEVPRPVLDFSNCKFPPKLRTNLEIAGYESPTPVQMQAIPAILKVRDVLISAGTGSGKTAGYLLAVVFRSCLIRFHYPMEARKPLAIILTPTRELCMQVEEQAKALAKGLPFKTALVVGGDPMPQQHHRISQGVELIVGTPGRLVDLLAKHDVELDNVCMLVLDEVDCMLERGFRDQVMQIQAALSQPQILMFSATIPPAIEKFSVSMLRRPILISVGKSSAPSEAVKQTVIWVESNQKKKKLLDILSSAHHFHPPVVVFVNSRVGAELLAEWIKSMTGLQAAALHGEKPMPERRDVLKAFLTGSLPILVATGLLGRGLDLIRVTQIISFDMPHSIEEYIHQIGRASRLDAPGSAMVFLNDDSKALFKDLIQLLQRSGVVVPKELSNSPYVASSYAASYNPRKRRAHHKAKR